MYSYSVREISPEQAIEKAKEEAETSGGAKQKAETPQAEVPQIEVPQIEVPQVEVSIPEVSTPEVPIVELPLSPDITLPEPGLQTGGGDTNQQKKEEAFEEAAEEEAEEEEGGYEGEPAIDEEWEEGAAEEEKKEEAEEEAKKKQEKKLKEQQKIKEGKKIKEEKSTVASDSADRIRIEIDPKTGKIVAVAVRVTGKEAGTINVAGRDIHIPPDTMVGVQKTPDGNTVVESSKPVGVDIPGPIDIKVSRVEISSSNGDIKIESNATFLGIPIPQTVQDKILGR